MNSTNDTALLKRYEELREAGNLAAQEGRLEEASSLLHAAWELAGRGDDRVLESRSFCNLAAIRIEQGRFDELLPQLRDVLVRNEDIENCRLAAYHLARAYERRKDYKKGLFYARIARERTESLPVPDVEWLASSHNQIGNFLVADSRFEEGLSHYREALALHPPSPVRRALIHNNIGYCHLMLGRFDSAFNLLFDSLRLFRRMKAEKLQLRVELDLCLACLETRRNRHALRHGSRALMIADKLGSESDVKNALYLLGEATHMLGDEESARRLFDRLQQHYPDTPYLTDFLLAIDVRNVINLRA